MSRVAFPLRAPVVPDVVPRGIAHRSARVALCSLLGSALLLLSGWSKADDVRYTLIHPLPTAPKAPNALASETSISATSLAMGGASTIALAAHGAFLDLATRRRQRMERDCGELCPDYRVEHYKEARRMARLSLSAGVLAAASSIWLLYHDPDDALRMARRGKRVRRPGLTLKLKPKKQGVWATMVARF